MVKKALRSYLINLEIPSLSCSNQLLLVQREMMERGLSKRKEERKKRVKGREMELRKENGKERETIRNSQDQNNF